MSNEMKKESIELDMDKKKFIKPDGGYGWVILFVAFVIFFLNIFILSTRYFNSSPSALY